MVASTGFVSLLLSLGLVPGLQSFPPKTIPSQQNFVQGASQPQEENASFCLPAPYNVSQSLALDVQFPAFDQTKANILRYREQRSVNLGSWFVQEQWMVPSIFSCATGPQVAEIDIATGGSIEGVRAILENHWDTFINASDFQYLASIGINSVRLPIGYWSLGPDYLTDTPFAAVADVYQNSWPRVLRAIKEAGDAGLGVLVDLHGAVGSQNGQPHSGISDDEVNLFNGTFNANRTVQILVQLASQLANVTNVIGIELLNEPVDSPELPLFYDQAITAMRQVSLYTASLPIYIHDAFDLENYSAYIGNRSDFVVLDHHSYFVYTSSDTEEPASQHTIDVDTSVADQLAEASTVAHGNLVIDEFSCALTPQSLANETDPDKARRDFCTEQVEVYTNVSAGWSFWSYAKEECDTGWCLKAAIGASLPSTLFLYGNKSTNASRIQAAASYASSMPLPPSPSNTSGSPWRRSATSLDHTRNNPRAHTRRDMVSDVGYSDGFLTARIFGEYGMSKLGFVEQYVRDSLAMHGMDASSLAEYRESFLNGLGEAEGILYAQL